VRAAQNLLVPLTAEEANCVVGPNAQLRLDVYGWPRGEAAFVIAEAGPHGSDVELLSWTAARRHGEWAAPRFMQRAAQATRERSQQPRSRTLLDWHRLLCGLLAEQHPRQRQLIETMRDHPRLCCSLPVALANERLRSADR
jgi:hypothetical protein